MRNRCSGLDKPCALSLGRAPGDDGAQRAPKANKLIPEPTGGFGFAHVIVIYEVM